MGLASFNRMRRLKAKRDSLDHDGDGKKGGAPKPDDDGDLASIRAAYEAKLGKKPFPGWSKETLLEKMAKG